LTIAEEVYNGTKTKRVMNQPLKYFGPTKTTGMGNKTNVRESFVLV
jgi:hypothetical protein